MNWRMVNGEYIMAKEMLQTGIRNRTRLGNVIVLVTSGCHIMHTVRPSISIAAVV